MRRLVAGLLACLIAAAAWGAASGGTAPGVLNPQRAWQNWTLNCQGCHRPDGSGSEGTTPSLLGTVARFLGTAGGREYLGRVPGVATSSLADAELSEVLNWMLWRFDREHLPPEFVPFTSAEVAALRKIPLRLEASRMRSDLTNHLINGGTDLFSPPLGAQCEEIGRLDPPW